MKSNGTTAAFPLFPIMFLIFLTLKLTGYIGWSWWWVTAPLWGGFIAIFVVACILVLLKELR